MESFDREALLSLLEIYESAISELESRREPRLRRVIVRLQQRRAEVIASLASRGRPPEGG
jgi:hypothetical protein